MQQAIVVEVFCNIQRDHASVVDSWSLGTSTASSEVPSRPLVSVIGDGRSLPPPSCGWVPRPTYRGNRCGIQAVAGLSPRHLKADWDFEGTGGGLCSSVMPWSSAERRAVG